MKSAAVIVIPIMQPTGHGGALPPWFWVALVVLGVVVAAGLGWLIYDEYRDWKLEKTYRRRQR